MIILSLISKINKKVAPKLLSATLNARTVAPSVTFVCDAICLPLIQRIISIEAQDDAERPSKSENSTGIRKFRLFPWIDSYIDMLRKQLISDSEGVSSKKERLHSETHHMALESYLRPALIPTEKFKDVKRWRDNTSFVQQFLRREILRSLYRNKIRDIVSEYPVLGPNKDKFQLPSRNLVRKAFELNSWTDVHNGYSHETERMKELCKINDGGELIKLKDGSTIVAELHNESQSLSKMDLADVVEIAGGFISSSHPFNFYCEEAGIYEVHTAEYIQELSSYLLRRAEEFQEKGDTLILEVGAGSGLLSKHISDFFEIYARRRKNQSRKNSKCGRTLHNRVQTREGMSSLPKVIATDDGSWHIKTRANVEKMSVIEALHHYAQPNDSVQVIVICSWMPKGIDWTENMRKARVSEYILLGESDFGSCGHEFKTWGNVSQPKDGSDDNVPPFIVDGYERKDLSMSKLQLSRYDTKFSRSSSTVSFRKFD